MDTIVMQKKSLPILKGLVFAVCAGQAFSSNAQSDFPQFTRIQPETFGGNMALSNAWGDYDNDGDLDLIVSFKTGDVRLYNNAFGQFTNVGPALGLPTGGKERRSIGWGDYDADGYLDIYIGSNRQGNELFHNDKSQGFTDVTEAMGVAVPDVSARQISWVDYDNNGTLDLFVADRVGANRLFRNEGGKFNEVAQTLGLDDTRATVGACWFDYNGDGLLDLFLANQGVDKDAMYRNDGGKFTDVAASLDMEGGARGRGDGGVDCTVGDYDNDGHFDLFVATYGINKLYKNNGEGGFTEVSEGMGIAGNDHMVGASWGDVDNDGLLDLFVAGYHDADGGRTPHDRVFHNQGEIFKEIDTHRNPLSGADHGIQWADFDADGDLDLSLTEGYNMAGRHPVLKNLLNVGSQTQSLKVNVVNQYGIANKAGSEVRVFDAAGNLLGLRLVSTGDGYNSHSNQAVHFGLAGVNQVTVEVTFLTSEGRKIQRVESIRPADLIGDVLTITQQ